MAMHWGLKLAAVCAVALYVIHAVFTQFYETGYGRVLSPVISLGLAGLFSAFILRRPWSWPWVMNFVVIGVIINLVFLPQEEDFGRYLLFAQVLVALEVTACVIMFIYMLNPRTKERFLANSAS